MPGTSSAINSTLCPFGAEPVNNLPVDAFVRDDLNPKLLRPDHNIGPERLGSEGDRCSISAAVSRGCSDKIWSTVSPAASFSKINSTVIRVPATVGFPS